MIPHDVTRQSQLIAFLEEQNPAVNSGWFLDFFFSDSRTLAEKLEIRKYAKGDALPLFYGGACDLPNIVKGVADSVTLDELTWPTIKAETKITGCDIDERRIMPNGDLIPVGMQRFNEAFNWQMSGITDGLRATHIGEAITLLKTGGYVLRSDETTTLGTVDFGRKAELSTIDLTATTEAWSEECARPDKFFEEIGRQMSRSGALAGVIDVIHSQSAWDAYEAHIQRNDIKFTMQPSAEFISTDRTPFLSYNDVQFKGSTNGGTLRHWVSNAQYIDHTGAYVDCVTDGDILIVSNGGFNGQRIFRSITSDNREQLPAGSLPYFVYDGIEEYERKCRSFSPWIEEYHLFVPSNVNGACLATVVDPSIDICVTC